MNAAMWRGVILLPLFILIVVNGHASNLEHKSSLHDTNEIPDDVEPYDATVLDEEYIRHIHSMFDAYRGDDGEGNIGGRLVIETNALINTKYRTWKRNADLINSLLALPKGMNEAGR